MAAGAAQFGLGDDRYPVLDFGVNQFAGVALAAVGLSVIALHEALTAGVDSSWGEYLLSICTAMPGATAFSCIKSASSPYGTGASSYE
jgi:hypothetical protein